MSIAAAIAGVAAGVLHLLVWCAESIYWRRPAVWRAFGFRTQDAADAAAPAFFHLGFYNAFLGLGAIAGAVMITRDDTPAVLVFACLMMVAAALVLMAHSPKLWRGAVMQATPALVALVVLALP